RKSEIPGECLSDSGVVGRPASLDPQAGGAGTKAERGHSCPQQLRTEVKLSNVPILLSIRELLRTRMSAFRWCSQNLRGLRRLSHLVIQAGGTEPRQVRGRPGDDSPYPPVCV